MLGCKLFYDQGFTYRSVFPCKEIHNSERRDEIEPREDLFEEVERATQHAFCAAEGFIEDECRYGRPDDVTKFSKQRNGISCHTDQVHQETERERWLFLHKI